MNTTTKLAAASAALVLSASSRCAVVAYPTNQIA